MLLVDVVDTAVYTTKSTTSTTTTRSPLSPCEQLRDASKHLLGNYVPRCTDNGDYDSLQCRGHPGTGTCWCADLSGREIPGTALSPPKTPDCKEGKAPAGCSVRVLSGASLRLSSLSSLAMGKTGLSIHCPSYALALWWC